MRHFPSSPARAAWLVGVFSLLPLPGAAQTRPSDADVQRRVEAVTPRVVAWRRDIHQHPELGNRELRTARLVADPLRGPGLEVHTGVAHTGVVAVLRGVRSGPWWCCGPTWTRSPSPRR